MGKFNTGAEIWSWENFPRGEQSKKGKIEGKQKECRESTLGGPMAD